MDEAVAPQEARFRTPPFALDSGAPSPGVEIAYWTLGELNAARDNAVLVCHGASGDRDWALPFCRPGGAFDPERWFVISVDAPGGGRSSRASTDADFPAFFSTGDIAQALLALVEGLGVGRLRAFSGQSMAGFVGLEMALRAPDAVGALALWTAGYRCDGFGQAVIGGLGGILALDSGERGFAAGAALFAPMALGRPMVAAMPEAAREAAIGRIAAGWRANWRADELIARYQAVARSDLAARYGGREALAGKVACPVLWLLASTDALLTPADLEGAETWWPGSRVKVLETGFGHVAPTAPPGSPEFAFFDGETAAFLTGL